MTNQQAAVLVDNNLRGDTFSEGFIFARPPLAACSHMSDPSVSRLLRIESDISVVAGGSSTASTLCIRSYNVAPAQGWQRSDCIATVMPFHEGNYLPSTIQRDIPTGDIANIRYMFPWY
jgi:hypothetical protein